VSGALIVTAATGGSRVQVRVLPRSPHDAIGGLRDGRLLVRVTAPPVDAAANDAVVQLIASTLSVPRRSVRVAAGARARNKTIEIAGLDADRVRERLAPFC
jgi:uncharacterized protein (TIGR00251 family)